jgi:Tol biopolymer transport system component
MPRLIIASLLALPATALALAQLPAALFQPEAVSGPKNEYNLSLSDNGRTMLFARSEDDFRGAKIMVAERRGRGWSTPAPIAFSDARYRDSDPWLTPDGRTLYFVSDRPTPSRPDKQDLDVWRSVKKEGRWSAPEHLGDLVNGRGEELGPELHQGALYFTTARKSGMGGLDVYAAKANGTGFDKPELLPAPINSPASESDFTLSSDGQTALFWRTVRGRGLIHIARRDASGAWSEATPLPASVNLGSFNFTPAISRDGKRISFASNVERAGQPAGMADIFEADLPTVLAIDDSKRANEGGRVAP